MTLSPRQAAVRDAIRELSAANGCAPTLRDIGEKVGLASPCSVVYVIDALERLGVVRREVSQGRRPVVVGDRCAHCAGSGRT